MIGMYLRLVASMALWGATWVSGRIVAQVLHPFSAAFLRFFFAGVFLYFLSCRTERHWPVFPRAAVWGVVFLGVSGVFSYNYFFFSGLSYIQAGRAALIVACVPSVVALYSAVVLRQPVTALKVLGIALSLSGVAVILSGGDLMSMFTHGVGVGDLFILGCVVAWSAYSLAGAKVMRASTPLSAVTWSCIIGDVLLLFPALNSGLVVEATAATPVIWAHLVFLGVGATGLAFTWYYAGILALGAPRASIFINLVPVFATLLSCTLMGEAVGASLVLGGGMVVTGVVLANRQGGEVPPRPQNSAVRKPAS